MSRNRHLMPTLCTVVMSGCMASFPARPAVTLTNTLDPSVFFAGRTHGDGTLDLRIGTDAVLTVDGTGQMLPDGRFQLDQSVSRHGGKADKRTWFMQRQPGDRFVATLSDAAGKVTGEVHGSLFHIRYLIRHPAVYMEQWMYLMDDSTTVKNFAQVTVLGIPWARLSETIVRRGNGPG